VLARSSSSACTTGPSPSCAGGSVTQTSRAGRIRVRSGLRARLEGEQAKANSYVVGKCKGKGDGGCRQVGEKAALAAKAHLEKSVSSATASDGYSGALPHMTREVEQ